MYRELESEVMDGQAEATAYDAMDHSEPNAAFVQRLTDLGASGTMLDIGTGPGHIPLLIVEMRPSARVIGIDRSPAMLEIARRRLRSTVGEQVCFALADAKCLPFKDDSFDAVVSNTILHHFADPRLLLYEAWRVLIPGRVFLVRDLFRPSDDARLSELVERYAASESSESRRLFQDSLKAALTPGELHELVRELRMNGVKVVVDTDRHMSLQGRKQ